jgi:lipopolysaccharide/colanic/teichoic acid biosynthesis glycosyltransferase
MVDTASDFQVDEAGIPRVREPLGPPRTKPLPIKKIPGRVRGSERACEPAPAEAPQAKPLVRHTCLEGLRENFRRLKGAFDFTVAFILLIITAPLILLLGVLTKMTSNGPILFSQIRVGQDGRLFRMYKLRSMITDSEEKTGPVWAQKNDPRVTPLGRFLRASHLDELPQLVNVLKGDMSLIGPRPERPAFVEQFCERFPAYRRRLSVKPGITGLAQVRHRYDRSIDDVRKKLAYDLLYIRKMCWAVDLGILLQTLGKLTGKGAH